MSNIGYENGPQRYYDEDIKRNLLIAPEDEYTIRKTETIEQQREYFRKIDAMARDPRHYVNCYHEPIVQLNELLSVNELGTIAKILPYIKMSSGGKLFYGNKRMGIVEVRKAIGKGQRQAKSLIKTLIDRSVMYAEYEGKRLVYGVSERYHTIGHTVNDQYYTKLFQVKSRTDLQDISIQAAGVLYKALPFFHYSRYYLCYNPNDNGENAEIKHMTQRKFADAVNLDRKVVERAIKELALNGFVLITMAYGAKVIRINPDVMFRQKAPTEYTEFVRKEFEQARLSASQNGVEIDEKDLPY